MIIAKSDTPHEDWQWDDSKAERLFKLLDNTIYSSDKKLKYEQQILAGLEEYEYLELEAQFFRDAINPVTMKG